MTLPTYWLSTHVDYRCQHAGACCSARWPIPLEASRVPTVEAAVAAGRLGPGTPARWLTETPDAPADVAGVLALAENGHCVFHRGAACAVQAAAGHEALPAACQHFPRVCLVDGRGVFVTLSHYCPTAARLLFDARGPAEVVAGPPALPDGRVPEGLDARDALPPLLTPRWLLGLDEYGVWEREAVAWLSAAHPASGAEARLARLRHDTERRGALRRPAPDTLALFRLARSSSAMPGGWPDLPDFEAVWTALVAPRWSGFADVAGRYLAARVFGNWVAYQADGLHAVVRWLDVCLATLRVEAARACRAAGAELDDARLLEAVRQADLLLLHHAEREVLAEACALA